MLQAVTVRPAPRHLISNCHRDRLNGSFTVTGKWNVPINSFIAWTESADFVSASWECQEFESV
jgi:hypothetical protein